MTHGNFFFFGFCIYNYWSTLTDAFELWLENFLEKTLESPLESKIKPVSPKGNQPWKFTGRTDAETEAPIVWPPDAKNWLTGKDLNDGKDWKQQEKGATEEELVSPTQWAWVWANSGDSEGQGNLAHCNQQTCRVRHELVTEQ